MERLQSANGKDTDKLKRNEGEINGRRQRRRR